VSKGWENVAEEFLAFIRGGDPGFDWHSDEFLELVPADARSVLDDGCGEGRLARMLAARGHEVTGVDGSPTLVRHAREADPSGTYDVADVRSLPFDDASFDCVVSFMVLQDVDDHTTAIREAARVLRRGGALCLAIVHPLSSAGDWASDDRDADFVVENYCGSFARERPLADRTVTQYHRPIYSYLSGLYEAGLSLDTLRELPTRRRSPGRFPAFLDLRGLRS
jgi:ubiquinone/menaquinone biosynthesis C-methylase UbiE